MEQKQIKLQGRIRFWIVFFIVGLVLSGITAFPLEWELSILKKASEDYLDFSNPLYQWISKVYNAIHLTNMRYPYLAYGTDWLAFAHLVIALAFVGPLKDPVRNIWIIQFGMIACIMVFPLAIIAGEIRSIPIYWRIIDCSFGVFGILPLYHCYRLIRKLEQLVKKETISTF